MKRIGLIGGMSWESTAVYYELINQRVKKLRGGFHSANCVMISLDFAEIEALQHAGDWQTLNEIMADTARQLEAAGARLLLLCTNTMHLCSEAIVESVSIPFLHIAQATGQAIRDQGLKQVALLGTRFTMEKDFYKEVLKQEFGIETLIPDREGRQEVHRVIYEELVQGEIKESSREKFKQIIGRLAERGAEGVILGCTEIPLLIRAQDVDIPIFDTTQIHADLAVDMALS
jgi:aspartate racemase